MSRNPPRHFRHRHIFRPDFGHQQIIQKRRQKLQIVNPLQLRSNAGRKLVFCFSYPRKVKHFFRHIGNCKQHRPDIRVHRSRNAVQHFQNCVFIFAFQALLVAAVGRNPTVKITVKYLSDVKRAGIMRIIDTFLTLKKSLQLGHRRKFVFFKINLKSRNIVGHSRSRGTNRQQHQTKQYSDFCKHLSYKSPVPCKSESFHPRQAR